MAHRWYYQLLNEEFGPVTEEEIRDLVEVGTLADDDPIRREDRNEWVSLVDMHSLGAATASDSGPSELGDLSELSFSFEDASEPPEIADAAGQLQMDEIQFEDASTRPNRRATSRASEAAPTLDVPDAWYCQSDGDVLGPMPLQTLIRMADRGMVNETDRVRNGESSKWVPCTDIAELAAAFLSLSVGSNRSVSTRNPGALASARSSSAEARKAAKSRGPAERSAPEVRSASQSPSRQKPRKPGSSRPGKPTKTIRPADAGEVPDDLFDEVFSEESTTPKRSRNAASAPVLASADGAPETGAQVSEVSAAPIEPKVPQPSAMHSAMAAAVEKSLPKPKKAPKPKRQFSAPSFSMPEPKTLGVFVGGVAAVLLLVGIFTGTITLSMLGFAPNPKSALTSFSNEYKSMAASTISNDDWRDFGNRVRPVVRQIQDNIIAKESRTSDDERYGKASGVLLRLVNVRAGDSEKQAEIFTEFQELLGGG